MTSVALFNNKGGVGKTTLTYHLAHMMNRLGSRVLVADLDPQANLTAAFLEEEDLAVLWDEATAPAWPEGQERPFWTPRHVTPGTGTVAKAVRPILEGQGEVTFFDPVEVADGLHVIPGDLELSAFEDLLSDAWLRSFTGSPAAIRTTTAFFRLLEDARTRSRADVVLIDVGPNLGAINRAALLAADTVLMPLAADPYSLRGLRNLGPTLRRWRDTWQEAVRPRIPDDIPAPPGTMHPAGYVIMQPVMRLDRTVRAYQVWLNRIPEAFAESVLGSAYPDHRDSFEIATVRNYQSLMPLAHDARKPMFDLKVADGALGSTNAYVQKCAAEFRSLAKAVLERLDRGDDATTLP